jgi:hypothetical protein
MAEQLLDVDDMVDDADIAAGQETKCSSSADGGKQAAAELLADMTGLSARERNKLKRKTKALMRTGSTSRECSPRIVSGCWRWLRQELRWMQQALLPGAGDSTSCTHVRARPCIPVPTSGCSQGCCSSSSTGSSACSLPPPCLHLHAP